jgi:hypothetical protein
MVSHRMYFVVAVVVGVVEIRIMMIDLVVVEAGVDRIDFLIVPVLVLAPELVGVARTNSYCPQRLAETKLMLHQTILQRALIQTSPLPLLRYYHLQTILLPAAAAAAAAAGVEQSCWCSYSQTTHH